MRVIGGHDYYDSAQAFGQDLETVFVRTPFDKAEGRPQKDCGLKPVEAARLRLKPGNHGRYAESEKVDNRKGRYDFTPVVVWFAGQRYACVRVEGYDPRQKNPQSTTWCAWNVAELKEFLASVDSGLVDSMWGGKDLAENNIDEWFSDEGSVAERDWLISNRVSIAISSGANPEWGYSAWKSGRVWKIDTDGLKEMGFARVVTPWDAFQRLSMWIGGTIAHPGRPIVDIGSDEIRRDKHGFDGMSFKKPKADAPKA